MACGTVRNLDIAPLRSFVTVAELGGVTRAAERLNLTQSAVSMQLKRLEAALDQQLVAREGRGIGLTCEGKQLLGYGRRMLRLNDEAWDRMMHAEFQGRVNFGVPEGIVRLYVSSMMRDVICAHPAAGINLVSSISRLLLTQFDEGRLDFMLTTEPISTSQGECLYRGPLDCHAWRESSVQDQRPLPLAAKSGCIFLPVASRAREQADIAWSFPYEATDWRDLTAFVSAGLAVETNMPYFEDIKDWERVPNSAGLPPLPDFGVFLCVNERASPLALQLAGIVRDVDFAPNPLPEAAMAPEGQ